MSDAPLYQVLHSRGLREPDGRPLYAYRVSASEYAGLSGLFASEAPSARSYLGLQQEKAFCLLAAEWWRRNHDHGPWAWHGILEHVQWAGISMPKLYRVVQQGLAYWKRPLLRLAAGDRAYLVTLACEGGLPLKLLLREGASLRNYFRGLLEDFQYLRPAGLEPAEIAQRGGHRLPLSLRQAPVFRLGGELVERVLELQSEVQNAVDPVATLDLRHPNWRDELPVHVEDDTARALLNNLVEEASRVRARPRGPALKIRRSLVRNGADWMPVAEIALPPRIDHEALAERFGHEAEAIRGRRFEFLLWVGGGPRRTVGLVTPRGAGDGLSYLVERLARFGAKWSGAEAVTDFELGAAYGLETLGPVSLSGGPGGQDLPWVYVDRSEGNGELEKVGQGTVRSRYAVVWVALPPECELCSAPGGEVERVGEVSGAGRALWRVRGGCEVLRSDGERFRVTCGEKSDHAADYVLLGVRAQELTTRWPLFLGPPKLAALSQDDSTRVVPAQALEWRRPGQPEWQQVSSECIGEVLLRYREHGAVEWTGRATILPSTFSVRFRPGEDSKRGEIELRGLPGAGVEVESQPELHAWSDSSPALGSCTLRFRSLDEPPANVRFRIRLASGSQFEAVAPYPVRLARFRKLSGDALPGEVEVPVSRLAELDAMVLTTGAEERFFLEGVLVSPSLDLSKRAPIDLLAPLQARGPYLRALELAAVQQRAARLLALAPDPEARVRLRVTADGAVRLPPRNLLAERHDLQFEWRPEVGVVCVSHLSGCSPDGEVWERLRVTARSLARPLEEEVELERQPGELSWCLGRVPEREGAWLLAGWEGGWCRVAPWVLPGSGPGNAGELGALTCAVSRDNESEIRELLAEMIEDPNHAGWEEFSQYVQALRGYPASAIRLFTALAALPDAIAMAFLMDPCQDRQALWEIVEELPICLFLQPVSIWARATSRLVSAEIGLDGTGSADSEPARAAIQKMVASFFRDARDMLPAADVLGEWALAVGGGASRSQTPTLNLLSDSTALSALQVPVAEERRALIARLGGLTWERSQVIERLCHRVRATHPELASWFYRDESGMSHREPLLNAPIVAAALCVEGAPLDAVTTLEILTAKEVDPAYFDWLFSMSLAAALAGRPREHQEGLR